MSPSFMEDTATLFKFWGYEPDDFTGQIVLDLGAGSKLRTKYFRNARLFVIEPLALRFLKLPFCDLNDAERVYSSPAENLIKELKGQASLIVCVNVLDHCYHPRRVLKNCSFYLAPGGQFLLSTDLHQELRDVGHPVGLTRQLLLRIVADAGFQVVELFEDLGLFGPAYTGASGDKSLTLKLMRAA